MENVMTTAISKPAIERKISRYKEEAYTYERVAKITIIIAAIFFAASIALAAQLVRSHMQSNSLLDQVHELQDTNRSLNEKLQNTNADVVSILNETIVLQSQNKILSDSISGMKNTIDKLDASNAKLIKDNKSLDKSLKKFENRAELYDKYEYAVYDKSGKRTDLTYSQIKTGEELMKAEGIDPDLLFGMIMTESGGDETATSSSSTARGYGQFLAGSGKYVYEKILHLGTYSHSMAYNGDTNIKMAAGYLGYLKNTRGFSAYAAVKAYRGVEPTAYIRTINSYIGKKGKSFNQIAANW